MIRALLLQILLLFNVMVPALADEPAGLELRGTGQIRYLGIFKVYDAYLYADFNKDVLSPGCSRCLRLDYAMGLSAQDIIDASEVILKKQHDKATLDAVKAELAQLYRNYKDVKEGDTYVLCYNARTGETSVTLNNILLVQITSPEFAAIYFGIWLRDRNPIDDGLRQKLLSGG